MKRGRKPGKKVEIRWSSEFAYALGLLTTDGSLSKDGRHISFTSKDRELIMKFLNSLRIQCHIGKKASGSQSRKNFVVQFGDILFYKFLLSIGLMPNKTKIISALQIPVRYFFDFLRGHFDGDGTFYSYWDPRWRSSFMFYTVFVSASKNHIEWLRREIYKLLKINGHLTKSSRKSTYQLKYAKRESLKLLRKMYYNDGVPCLSRKRLKIEKALRVR